jgi:hypothetical protein
LSARGRLVLGSDSYRFPHTALSDRLADIAAQRHTAGRTDFAEQLFRVR